MIFILTYGDIGDNVKNIQTLLLNLGFHLKVDGIYGVNTMNAVKEFQNSISVHSSGKVDKETYEKLLITKGMKPVVTYINSQDLHSKTSYLIHVNLKNHLVYIFKGKNKQWEIAKTFPATVGKKDTPTLTGLFKVGAKGPGYGGEYKGFKVKWYTQFYNNYLFHSIIYNLDNTVFDGRLGQDLSDGCVRLRLEDAKYIYDYVPFGSTVFII